MEGNTRQYIRVGQILGLLLGILVFFSSVPAEAGDTSGQHVTPPAESTWNQNITAPYSIYDEPNNTYTYYGLFVELGSIEHYTVDCALSLDLNDISGNNTTEIYGVHYANTSGTLEVQNSIDIKAAGLNPAEGVVSNAVIDLKGINAGANVVTSSAGITLTATGGTATVSTGNAFADTYAYGIDSTVGAVTNTGAISIDATGGTANVVSPDRAYARAYAYGIRSTGGGVTNEGDIEITAEGGTTVPGEDASAYCDATVFGIHSAEGGVTNSGNILVTGTGGSPTATSVSSKARVIAIVSNNEGPVTNTGTIKSVAIGGEVPGSSSHAEAFAYGISTSKSGVVTNTGTILAVGTGGTANGWVDGKAYGIYSVTPSEVINEGTISAIATGGTGGNTFTFAYGILGNGPVTNTGTSTGEATGGTGVNATANAWGIRNASGGVTNTGTATSKAKGGLGTDSYARAYAYGIDCVKSGVVANKGTVSTTAEGGTGNSVYAKAYGIKAIEAVDNSGTVSATAIGGDGTTDATATTWGIYSTAGAVTNTGTISATAYAGTQTVDGNTTSADASAYGIYFKNGGELRSSGQISADAQFASEVSSSGATRTAYQVYCESGTVSIKQYAMEVGHSQSTFTAMYEGQFGTGEGGVITFDDTELVVHVTDDYQNGVYNIPRLWKQETEEQKATTINQFATANTAVPGLIYSLIPSGDVDTPQKIRLGYAPKESTPLKQARIQTNAESAIHSLIENNLIDRFLSGTRSGDAQASTASASSFGIGGSSANMVASLSNPNILPAVTSHGVGQHSLLFLPVYANSYDSAASGYSSNTYGFVLGYDYNVYEDSNDCIIGVHAGYTRGDIRYTGEDYGDRKEFVDTYYGGVHGLTRFAEDFIFSGEASFFYVDSEMRDDEPTRLGKADYDSVALRAVATVGYLWDIAEHTIVPELGLDYSWQHRNSFTVNNQNSPDIKYGTLDNNELYAKARLKWLARYELSPTWTIIPLLGVGVTQVLTDGEISNTMRLGNETQLVVDQDENTTFTPEANITVSSDDYQFMAGYAGGFGGTTKNNMFWLQLSLSF